MGVEDVPTQPPRIGIADVVDPALYAGIELGERDLLGFV